MLCSVLQQPIPKFNRDYYQRTFAKFAFTVIKMIRQWFILSARNEIGGEFGPWKATFVVNAYGDAERAGEAIKKLVQPCRCKFITRNNLCFLRI